MSSSRRKLEDQNLKILKALQQLDTNKRCFECDQRGPTYVDVTIGSFVCTSCGGILRGINPPHRVKSISMATFTPAEIALIQKRGNAYCAKVFLGRYDERSKAKPETRGDVTKLRMYMEEKYEKKRWYVSPEEVERDLQKAAEPKIEVEKPAAQARPAPVKAAVPAQKVMVDNILGDFTGLDINPTPQAQANAVAVADNSFGFADFNAAFSQQAPAPGAAASANNNQAPLFDAFADFSAPQAAQPIAFETSFPPMNAPVQAAAPQAVAPTPKNDKYADLGNLFSLDAATTDSTNGGSQSSSSTLWGSVFMTSVTENKTDTSNTSVFSGGSVFDSSNQQPSTQQFVIPQLQQQQQQYPATAQQQQYGMKAGDSFGMPFRQQQQQNGNNGFSMSNAFATNNAAQQQQQAFSYKPAQAFQPINPQQPSSGMFASPAAPQAQTYMAMPTQQSTSANPFFQQQPAQSSAMAPPSGGNPFIAAQQTWSKPNPQANSVSATNPFMNTASIQPQAAAPPQASTNPFF